MKLSFGEVEDFFDSRRIKETEAGLCVTIESHCASEKVLPNIKKWETELLSVPEKQTGYPEVTRPATPGEYPKKCPCCDNRFVSKVREHANVRHLPWWLDPTAACGICKASCGKASRLEAHIRVCHLDEADARLSFEDWREKIIPYVFMLARRLNLPGLKSLIRYVNEKKLGLEQMPTLSHSESQFHCAELDGPTTPYDPVNPKSMRDLCHWRVMLNLIRAAGIDGEDVQSFTPWQGYMYVTKIAPRVSSGRPFTTTPRSGSSSNRCEQRTSTSSESSLSDRTNAPSQDRSTGSHFQQTRQKTKNQPSSRLPRRESAGSHSHQSRRRSPPRPIPRLPSQESAGSHSHQARRRSSPTRQTARTSGSFRSRPAEIQFHQARERSPIRHTSRAGRTTGGPRSYARDYYRRAEQPSRCSSYHRRPEPQRAPESECQFCRKGFRPSSSSTPGQCDECVLKRQMKQLDATAEHFMQLYNNVRSLHQEICRKKDEEAE